MNFIVDKNTNRIVYATESEQWLLDDYTYLHVGKTITFAEPFWSYKLVAGEVKLADKPPVVGAAPGVRQLKSGESIFNVLKPF